MARDDTVSLEYNWRGFAPIIIVFALGSFLILLSGNYTEETALRLFFAGLMFLFVGFITLFAVAISLLSKYYVVRVLSARIEEEMQKKREEELLKEEQKEKEKEEILEEIF